MLAYKYRLPAHIRLIHPFTVRTTSCLMKVATNNLQHSRFGFIIRKSREKNAVKRNRIRRVFRSCIEEKLDQIKNGYDMLFLLERDIIETKRETLWAELEYVLRKKGLLQNEAQ